MTTIFTVGHSSRTIEAFVSLLKQADIECLVDVRANPASRRHPQFARIALEPSLSKAGIRYVWEGKALGGRRKFAKDSPHAALKEPGFRAYADHMGTEEFQEGVARLVVLGRATRAAIMCAERLPSECHRAFISDYLVAQGEEVTHLLEAGAIENHCLNTFARRCGGGLIYDSGTQGQLKL